MSIFKKLRCIVNKFRRKQNEIVKPPPQESIKREAPKKKAVKIKGLGIDVGIATFATFSDGYTVSSPFHKYNLKPNFMSYESFSTYRNEAHEEAIRHILKEKPTYIAIETINLSGGNIPPNIKDRARYLDFELFFARLRALCIKENIELRQLYSNQPSSKRCYKCGEINRGLSLSDRIYKCPCGHTMDRDLNAALNICYKMKYKVIANRK